MKTFDEVLPVLAVICLLAAWALSFEIELRKKDASKQHATQTAVESASAAADRAERAAQIALNVERRIAEAERRLIAEGFLKVEEVNPPEYIGPVEDGLSYPIYTHKIKPEKVEVGK